MSAAIPLPMPGSSVRSVSSCTILFRGVECDSTTRAAFWYARIRKEFAPWISSSAATSSRTREISRFST